MVKNIIMAFLIFSFGFAASTLTKYGENNVLAGNISVKIPRDAVSNYKDERVDKSNNPTKKTYRQAINSGTVECNTVSSPIDMSIAEATLTDLYGFDVNAQVMAIEKLAHVANSDVISTLKIMVLHKNIDVMLRVAVLNEVSWDDDPHTLYNAFTQSDDDIIIEEVVEAATRSNFVYESGKELLDSAFRDIYHTASNDLKHNIVKYFSDDIEVLEEFYGKEPSEELIAALENIEDDLLD